MILYRPVNQAELDLIAASGYRAFPPRLPDQRSASSDSLWVSMSFIR